MSESVMSKHTPGPWQWGLNLASKQVRLCGGKVKYDLTVMDFVRWGMSNAAPRFNVERQENLHLMTRADELSVVVPGREHHSDWFRDIDHPDARLIAAAPDMLEAIEETLQSVVMNRLHDTIEISRDAIELLRAALAKAKGGV